MPAARSSEAIALTGSVANRPADPVEYGLPTVLGVDVVWDEKVHHVCGDPFDRDDGKSGRYAKADPDVGLELIKLSARKLREPTRVRPAFEPS